MDYSWDFGVVLANYPVLLWGLAGTVALWVPCILIGTCAGFAISLWRVSPARWRRWTTVAYVEVFRDTPVLIQLIWFYYAFPIVIGVQLSPFAAAALGLTLNTSAYCSEIFRGGLLSLPKGQWEGAKALGMGRTATMRRVVLPQVVKEVLPALTNRAIELAKTTSLASILSVHELMYQGRLLSSVYYRPLEVLTTVALVYFLIIYPGSFASARLERRLHRRS